MIFLRCTARVTKTLGLAPLVTQSHGTSPLGDWYVNLIPTHAGGAFLFVNEQSLLAVVVPNGTPNLMHVFVARVGNILSMIGVPNERIERELEHFHEIRVAKTNSKRILGVMNDLALHCQLAAERATPEEKLSLSDLELSLAEMPQSTLEYRRPMQVALALLQSSASFGPI